MSSAPSPDAEPPSSSASDTPAPDPDPDGHAPTHGPLASLEENVPSDWWRTLFGPTYLLTDGDVLTDESTRQEIDAVLRLLRLKPEARILDLCCGQGRHALELARRGFERVEGLDRSAYLIGEARKAAEEENLGAAFQEGDCRALPFDEGAFDAVLLMGNSFGYFETEDDDHAVLQEVRRVLRPGGRVFLDLASGAYLREHFEARSWEWIDEKHFVCRERELAEEGRRLVSREVIAHVEKGVLKDQLYAERLYSRDEIRALLEENGFGRFDAAPASETLSTRGQDLGMMARRLFITARTPSDASGDGQPAEAAAQPTRSVAVVLGDPRLPDAMKREGVFGEEDFEVIRRLKEALATLRGYRFTYLDDHATLPADLQNLRGEVDLVFNLCDEGLMNDPRQELHVPALLDIAGLPYTGAGPQCLAACYDKSLVRGVAREMGIAVARARFIAPGEAVPQGEKLGFPYPALVKPNTGDSSYGLTQKSFARNADELAAAVASTRAMIGDERALLIEEFLPGKDLTIGFVGNPEADGSGLTALPIAEENYGRLPEGLPELCGYEAKWEPDSPYYMQDGSTLEADLPESVRREVEEGSRRLFARLRCRDYARFDWRLDAEGRPRLLEVNPNPGWCWDGHLAVEAAFTGHDYAAMLRLVLDAAFRRTERTPAGTAARETRAEAAAAVQL